MMSAMSDQPQPVQVNEIKFTYQKGNFYRVIHVDGAHGGVSPSARYIHMNLFSERRTIPKEQFFLVPEQGVASALGPPFSTTDIGGIFREIETCAVMDIDTAKAIHAWLGKKISEFKVISDAIHASDLR